MQSVQQDVHQAFSDKGQFSATPKGTR